MNTSLEDQLRSAWQQASEQFITDGGPLLRSPTYAAADCYASWSDGVVVLERLFVGCFGAATTHSRFMVPHDYATFMQIIGGGWKWPHRLDWYLFDAQRVVESTSYDVELWLNEEHHEYALDDSGLWLRIGSWSDKHDYLLCCDREHAYFGSIVNAHDTHPWAGEGMLGCARVANSFLDWLKIYGKRH
jgi:hypothetical protein